MIIDLNFNWNFSVLRLLICSWNLNLFHCILVFCFKPYKIGTTPWTTKLSNAENQRYSCIKFTLYIIYHCQIVYVAQNLTWYLISKNHNKHLFLKYHFILPRTLFTLCVLDVSRHYKYILFHCMFSISFPKFSSSIEYYFVSSCNIFLHCILYKRWYTKKANTKISFIWTWCRTTLINGSFNDPQT